MSLISEHLLYILARIVVSWLGFTDSLIFGDFLKFVWIKSAPAIQPAVALKAHFPFRTLPTSSSASVGLGFSYSIPDQASCLVSLDPYSRI